MDDSEKNIYIDMLCTGYDREDLEDVYYDDELNLNHLRDLKHFNKEIIKKAINRYNDEEFAQQRELIRADCKKGSFQISMKVDNYCTEMSNEEIENYIKKVLRYANLTVIQLDVK